MEENTILPVEEYLKGLGIEIENLSDKEKLKILSDILLRFGVDRDIEELRYSKIPLSEKTEESRNEYIKKINNIEIDILNVQRYIGMIKYIQREKRKVQIKNSLQKAIGTFKRKYTKLN